MSTTFADLTFDDILENIVKFIFLSSMQDQGRSWHLVLDCPFDIHLWRAQAWLHFTEVNRKLRAISLPYSVRAIKPYRRGDLLSFARRRAHLGKYVRFLDTGMYPNHDEETRDLANQALRSFTSLVEFKDYPVPENGFLDYGNLTCRGTLTSLHLYMSSSQRSVIHLPDFSRFPKFRNLYIKGPYQHSDRDYYIAPGWGNLAASTGITVLYLKGIDLDSFASIASTRLPSLRALCISLVEGRDSFDDWLVVFGFITAQPSLSDVALVRVLPFTLDLAVELAFASSVDDLPLPSQFSMELVSFSFEREYDKLDNEWKLLSMSIYCWHDPTTLPIADHLSPRRRNILNSVKALTIVLTNESASGRVFAESTRNLAIQCAEWTGLEYLSLHLAGGSNWGDGRETTRKWHALVDSAEPPHEEGHGEVVVWTFKHVEYGLLQQYPSHEVARIMKEMEEAHDQVFQHPGPGEQRLLISLWEIYNKPRIAAVVQGVALQCPTLKRLDWNLSSWVFDGPCVWRWDIERLDGRNVQLDGKLFYHLEDHISDHGVPRWEVDSLLTGRLLRERGERWAFGPLW